MAASAQVCPVIGTTTTSLPPNHPTYDTSNLEARCPVTNAKVAHHNANIIHNHPDGPTIPHEIDSSMDAKQCPALKNANSSGSVTDATCPVVGPVSAYLPPTHPDVTKEEAGKVCPVTNATLEHHEGRVQQHPRVPNDASAQKCPVAGAGLSA